MEWQLGQRKKGGRHRIKVDRPSIRKYEDHMALETRKKKQKDQREMVEKI